MNQRMTCFDNDSDINNWVIINICVLDTIIDTWKTYNTQLSITRSPYILDKYIYVYLSNFESNSKTYSVKVMSTMSSNNEILLITRLPSYS